MITLTNAFHNTEYRTSLSDREIERREEHHRQGNTTEAERAWIRRVRRALCSAAECQCAGNILGERFPTDGYPT